MDVLCLLNTYKVISILYQLCIIRRIIDVNEPSRTVSIWIDGTNPIEMEFKDNAMIRMLNERKEKSSETQTKMLSFSHKIGTQFETQLPR